MKLHRKINYNDYEPDLDVCHDKALITYKYYPFRKFVGWIKKIDNNIFQFEFVYKGEYVVRVLSYDKWIVKYLS